MIDYRIIGNRINKQRIKTGLTQENLASRIGVSTNYLSKVERGKEKANLEMLNKICIHINYNLAFLLLGVCEKEYDYLHCDFANLLENCSPEKKRLIYYLVEKLVEFEDYRGT